MRIRTSARPSSSKASSLVSIKRIGADPSPFGEVYNPSHPSANADGYVQTPNVNTLIEMSDMREAGRSYDANLKVIEQARSMAASTLSLLDGNR